MADIPLESTLRPGGPGILNSLQAINALTKSNIENKYLPYTQQAEAASKLAYAQLMGPQFLAKLFGNDSVLANLTEDQKTSGLNSLYKAGTGAGTGNSLVNQVTLPSNNAGGPDSIAGYLVNKLKGFFDSGSNQNSPSSNALTANPAPTQNVSNRDAQVTNTAMQNDTAIPTSNVAPVNNSVPAAKQNVADITATPAGDTSDLPQSFADNAARFKGILKEGEEFGALRAKQAGALDDVINDSQTSLTTLDSLGKIVSSPTFEQIRQVPLAGKKELEWYAVNGNKEQQNMIGQYKALSKKFIADGSNIFKGQFRTGEQALFESMKPNEGDTVDVVRGKVEALTVMQKMLQDRAQLMQHYMRKYHYDQSTAKELADQKLDGDSIRAGIHDKLNPTVTLKNPKTGEVMTLPIGEARQRGYKHG